MDMCDWRLLQNGNSIPTVAYADQPYVVKTDDGAWLCCVTTGEGDEGEPGQHVSTCRSTDFGRSWSVPVAVEPPGSVENSYAVLLKVPSGRIFLFYNHNTDNVREIESHDRSMKISRVDSLGHFVFKYSDDGGRSWSRERYDIPIRRFDCDLENIYGGKLCFFWNVGRPFFHGGTCYVSLNKVGEMGRGFFQRSEGALLASPDLATVADPADATWETLPEGTVGLRTPPGGGKVAEEHCFLALSDGSFHDVYRSIDGYPVEAYSRDGGRSWPEIAYMRCGNNSRPVKHPRAANFAWKCSNGRYLYWFHNHGGHFLKGDFDYAYEDRNPVWLLAGIEVDSPRGRVIRWGEPEILLYSDDPLIRISYPDLIEDGGRYFVTETEKHEARVHEIPAGFLEKMWRAVEGKSVACNAKELQFGERFEPPYPWKRDSSLNNRVGCPARDGYAIAVELPPGSAPGELFNHRGADGRGELLELTRDGRFVYTLDDGTCECRMASEPVPGIAHGGRLVVNVDCGPAIVGFLWNGCFLDGGEDREFGWRRFDRLLVSRINRLKPHFRDGVRIRFFDRAVMTAEAPALFE